MDSINRKGFRYQMEGELSIVLPKKSPKKFPLTGYPEVDEALDVEGFPDELISQLKEEDIGAISFLMQKPEPTIRVAIAVLSARLDEVVFRKADPSNPSWQERYASHYMIPKRVSSLFSSLFGRDYERGRRQPVKLSALLKATDAKCKICGQRYDLEIDHIVPVTDGGTNGPSNLQILCRRCHHAKHSGSPIQVNGIFVRVE